MTHPRSNAIANALRPAGKLVKGVLIHAVVIVGLMVILLILPILFPMSWFSLRLERKRLVKAANDFECLVCGATLGAESVRLADEVWAESMKRLHREHPGVKFRIVRLLQAVCSRCGREYKFDRKGLTFVPLEQDARFLLPGRYEKRPAGKPTDNGPRRTR